MFELASFPYRPAANEFRRAALVGDVVSFQRTDLVSPTSVTLTTQPAGSDVQLTTVAGRIDASALTVPGVYTFAIVADNMYHTASVYCWPRAILTFRPFVFTNQTSSILRKPDEVEPLVRRVLHSLVGDVRTSDDSLFAPVGFSAALIGGAADDGVNLRLYGTD
jgi:hypothetical protein